MSRPWMPLYIADYLKDTAHLRALESGAYLHLIMAYWANGGLPQDGRHLATIAKVTDKEWKAIRHTLENFFGPNWSHKRIDAELSKAADKYLRRANAGKKGGKAKASGKQNPSNARANGYQSQSEDKYSEANASAASAAIAPPPNETPEAKLWRIGLTDLMALGLSESRARSMIGSWRRDTGDDCQGVLGAIMRAREYAVANPIPWISAALKPRKPDEKSKSVHIAADELVADIRKLNDRPGGVRGGEGAAPVRLLSSG